MKWELGGGKSLKIGLNSPRIANALSAMKSIAQNKTRTKLQVFVCLTVQALPGMSGFLLSITL